MRLKPVACSLLAAGIFMAGIANAAAPTQISSAAGEIRDFVAVSATVGYAATYGGGLWKSSDSGANWTKTSLPAKIVWKVSINAASAGARLYAATEQGIYRSTDAGATWTQLTQDPARAVAVSPGSAAGGPDTVLMGVRGAGVYRTTDSGTTITRQSAGLDSADVLAIVFQPGSSTTAYTLLQCNVENLPTLSGNFGGVFKTTTANGGVIGWGAFSTGLPPPSPPATGVGAPCVNAIAATGTAGAPFIVAGVKDPNNGQGGVYFISGVVNNTWSTSATTTATSGGPYGVEFLGSDFSSTNGVFIGSNQFGPWFSADGGNNFGQIYTRTTDPDFETTAFATGGFTGTVRVAGIGGIGLFRSITGASEWSLPAGPIRADRVNDLTNHNGALPAVYFMALNKGGVMRSTNSGASWAGFSAGLNTSFGSTNNNFVRNVQVIGAHPNNGSVVALGVRTFGLYQTNGTSTWTGVAGFSENTADHKAQSIVITPGGKVYYSLFDGRNAPGPGGMYQSTATGTTVGTLASSGIPLFDDAVPTSFAPGAGRIRLSPSNPEARAFLVMNDQLPYLTTNGGASWSRVVSSDTSAGGFQRHQFTDVAEKPGASVIVVAATNKGIFRSLNGGANFSRVNATGLAQHALAALVYHSNNVLFGGDFAGQLYCSVDDGVTWQSVSSGNLGYNIRDMKFMDGFVQVLTDGGGVFKKDGVCP